MNKLNLKKFILYKSGMIKINKYEKAYIQVLRTQASHRTALDQIPDFLTPALEEREEKKLEDYNTRKDMEDKRDYLDYITAYTARDYRKRKNIELIEVKEDDDLDTSNKKTRENINTVNDQYIDTDENKEVAYRMGQKTIMKTRVNNKLFDVLTMETDEIDPLTGDKILVFPFPTTKGGHDALFDLVVHLAYQFEGKCIYRIDADCVQCLAVLPSGNLVSSNSDTRDENHKINVWDMSRIPIPKENEEVCLISHHDTTLISSIEDEDNSSPTCFAVFPNGNFVSGNWKGTIKLWDMSTKIPILTSTLKTGKNEVVYLYIYNPKRMFSVSANGFIQAWIYEGSDFKLKASNKIGIYIRCALKIPSTNYLLIGEKNGTIRFIDLSRVTKEILLVGHKESVNCLILQSTNEIIVSGSDDKTIKIWATRSLKCIATYVGEFTVRCFAMLHDGNIVSGDGDGDEGYIKIWDFTNLKSPLIGRIEAHPDPSYVSCLAVLPNGNLVSGSNTPSDFQEHHLESIKIWK